MAYIYDLSDWPVFCWDDGLLAVELAALRFRQGAYLARMESLGFSLRSQAVLQTLTEDVVKTSEIEGEILDRGQVLSSLARRLGVDAAGLVPSERNVDGVVDMLLDGQGITRRRSRQTVCSAGMLRSFRLAEAVSNASRSARGGKPREGPCWLCQKIDRAVRSCISKHPTRPVSTVR